MVRVTL
jgi:hypothetical protein